MNRDFHIKKAMEALGVAMKHLGKVAGADAMKSFEPEMGETNASAAASPYLEAIRANAHKLTGRMTAAEVQEAIGVKIRHGDRVAFGLAVSEFGAKRGRSGSQRYYIFK